MIHMWCVMEQPAYDIPKYIVIGLFHCNHRLIIALYLSHIVRKLVVGVSD